MAVTKPTAERQKFWFQFITTPTADTPGTTLLLHFDNRRYMFGQIAEGTQRACIQRGIGLRKVKNMFLTGPTTWNNMGGLIGMILTMADVQAEEREGAVAGVTPGKRPRINIFGGPKLMHAMACARRFVFRTGMPLSVQEVKWDESNLLEPYYADENIDVWALPVRTTRSGTRSPIRSNGRSASPTTLNREQDLRAKTVNDMFDSDWKKDRLFESRFDQVKLPALIWVRDPATKDLKQYRCTTMQDAPHLSPDSVVLVRNPWPAAMVEALPPADNLPGSVSTSYIIRGQPQRGRFLPQKAKELGIQPGPDYTRLIAGETITLENGTVITQEMVMTEPEPGRGMAIFDVPSAQYLHDLAHKIDQLRENQILLGLQAISWLLGPGVYESSDFQSLLGTFSSVENLISSPDTNANYIALDSSAASAKRLSMIRPECFPAPIYSDNAKIDLVQEQSGKKIKITAAERGMLIEMSPNVAIDTTDVPPLLNTETVETYDEIQALIPDSKPPENGALYNDIEITTLGTGSAVPSKYRNVSATLVRIPGLGSYLFDCGENTIGQLKRTYSSEQLEEILCDLRMIWISHLHADHHLGTLSVINARQDAVRRGMAPYDGSDLYIISEPNMADFLQDFSSVQSSSGCTLLSVWNSELKVRNAPISVTATPLNIKSLRTVRVAHCHGAQAIAVTFSNGFKFSYSGDCRPSSAFADIGRDSHILLHEATFDDGKEGDAMAKKHCTTGEALGVAAAMKAKNVILTHFSQRYQKIPVLANIKFADQIKFEEGDETEIDGEMDNLTATNGGQATAASTADTVRSNTMLTQAATAMDMNICVAFDQMRIKYSHIPSMHQYYPAIERMFEIQLQKSEEKREEAAVINDQRIAAKQAKTGQKKLSHARGTSNGSSSKKSGTTDPYEKINRSKTARNGHGRSNSNLGSGGTTSKDSTTTGPDSVAAGQPDIHNHVPTASISTSSTPQMSNRALKRQRAAKESKQSRETEKDPQQILPEKEGVPQRDSSTADVHDLSKNGRPPSHDGIENKDRDHTRVRQQEQESDDNTASSPVKRVKII